MEGPEKESLSDIEAVPLSERLWNVKKLPKWVISKFWKFRVFCKISATEVNLKIFWLVQKNKSIKNPGKFLKTVLRNELMTLSYKSVA